MRPGTKPPEIPVLSDSLLRLADLCARELWVGTNFVTGKPQQYSPKKKSNQSPIVSEPVALSDEHLLAMFAIPFYASARVHGQKVKVPLPIHHIDPYFINIAGLNAARNPPTQGIKDGVALLLSSLSSDYKNYISGKCNESSIEKAATYTSKLVEAFGEISEISHRALAFRILFFAIPDFPCFNYSVEIVKALKLSTNESNFFSNFVNTLDRGYQLNWERLSQFEMPLPYHLDPTIWQLARNHGWWQRRIFDLALLIFFSHKDSKKLIKPNTRVMHMFHTRSLPYA